MKILHVVPSYLPAVRYGGTIYAVHGLCKALVSAGHKVVVFTTNVDGDGNSDVPINQAVYVDGVEVWYFPTGLARRLYRSPQMAKALKTRVSEFDIVHLHSVFLWPIWKAARVARRAAVPYLLTPHGMLVGDLIKKKSRFLKKSWIRLFERRTIRQAAGIQITAKVEGKEIKELGLDQAQLYYVPNGIEATESDVCGVSTREDLPDPPYVLFLSRINWKKGLDRLVRAWPMVQDSTLVIAGNDEENYLDEIRALAKSQGVTNRIKFIGPVHGADKWHVYRNAMLFVLPSYSENFGIVVLEAMAMACPVVVTPDVGLASSVKDSECGVVVNGEPQQIANAVNRLITDEPERIRMGIRGRQLALDKFSWGTVAQKMERVYVTASGVAD